MKYVFKILIRQTQSLQSCVASMYTISIKCASECEFCLQHISSIYLGYRLSGTKFGKLSQNLNAATISTQFGNLIKRKTIKYV